MKRPVASRLYLLGAPRAASLSMPRSYQSAAPLFYASSSQQQSSSSRGSSSGSSSQAKASPSNNPKTENPRGVSKEPKEADPFVDRSQGTETPWGKFGDDTASKVAPTANHVHRPGQARDTTPWGDFPTKGSQATFDAPASKVDMMKNAKKDSSQSSQQQQSQGSQGNDLLSRASNNKKRDADVESPGSSNHVKTSSGLYRAEDVNSNHVRNRAGWENLHAEKPGGTNAQFADRKEKIDSQIDDSQRSQPGAVVKEKGNHPRGSNPQNPNAPRNPEQRLKDERLAGNIPSSGSTSSGSSSSAGSSTASGSSKRK